MTSCVANKYFSGQGSLLLATKDGSSGDALGFTPVGNVSALTLSIETETVEHKESCTGARAIDKELVTEVAVNMAFTMENFSKENLALALYGSSSEVTGASVADELVTARHDKWVSLTNIKVSAVVVGDDATPTVTYVLDTDYELNAETGSIKVLSTGSITDLQVVYVDYTFDTHEVVEAVETSSAPERWARFEGLNTANEDKAVVVDIYKASMQPLAELALINEEFGAMEIEAKVLSDATRASGSKFFTYKQVA